MEYGHYTPAALFVLLCLLRYLLRALGGFEVDSRLLQLPLLRILDQLLVPLVVEYRFSILGVLKLLLLRQGEGNVSFRERLVLCDYERKSISVHDDEGEEGEDVPFLAGLPTLILQT